MTITHVLLEIGDLANFPQHPNGCWIARPLLYISILDEVAQSFVIFGIAYPQQFRRRWMALKTFKEGLGAAKIQIAVAPKDRTMPNFSTRVTTARKADAKPSGMPIASKANMPSNTISEIVPRSNIV